MNEVDNFFDSLPTGEKESFNIKEAFDAKEITEEKAEEKVSQSTDTEAPVEEELPFAKNPKIQKFIERQVRRQLEGFKETRPSESETFQKEVREVVPNDVPAEWLMAYGDSPESKKAWDLQQSLIQKAIKQAKEEAVNEVRNDFQKQIEAEKQFESFITNSLEGIEDTHDVDLTSNSPAAKKVRSEFLELVKNLSPKDADGNVTGYADFNATWELFQSTRQKEQSSVATNQKKAIASRSMTKSNEGTTYDVNAPKQRLGFDSFSF